MSTSPLLNREFRELRAARDDIEGNGHEQASETFSRLVSILDREPIRSHLNEFLPPHDFEHWWVSVKSKTTSTSGRPQPGWPLDLAPRVALQIAFCRAAAKDRTYVYDYVFHRIGTSRPLNTGFSLMLKQVVDPMIRDIEILAEYYVPPIGLEQTLQQLLTKSWDTDLDRLIAEAVTKFRDPAPTVRREALEKIWDAFERLKTILDPADKKRSVTRLITGASGSIPFRGVLDTEAIALTDIGNTYQIRHHELSKHPLDEATQIDYLFQRCAATVHLFLLAYVRTRMTTP